MGETGGEAGEKKGSGEGAGDGREASGVKKHIFGDERRNGHGDQQSPRIFPRACQPGDINRSFPGSIILLVSGIFPSISPSMFPRCSARVATPPVATQQRSHYVTKGNATRNHIATHHIATQRSAARTQTTRSHSTTKRNHSATQHNENAMQRSHNAAKPQRNATQRNATQRNATQRNANQRNHNVTPPCLAAVVMTVAAEVQDRR